MLPLLTRTKTEVMRERDNDSYYLVYIGTKPNARSRGYATKLLQLMIMKVRVLVQPPSSSFILKEDQTKTCGLWPSTDGVFFRSCPHLLREVVRTMTGWDLCLNGCPAPRLTAITGND